MSATSLAISPIDSFRSNYLKSLTLCGLLDEATNDRYNAMLPIGGEESLVGSIHAKMKGKYIPFAGFVLARYTANECNIKGTSRAYLEHYNLRGESLPSFIKACYRIINFYNQLPEGETEVFDLVGWGAQINEDGEVI